MANKGQLWHPDPTPQRQGQGPELPQGTPADTHTHTGVGLTWLIPRNWPGTGTAGRLGREGVPALAWARAESLVRLRVLSSEEILASGPQCGLAPGL